MTALPIFPELRDRVVLVTGAGAGIGAATARAFQGQGARLVLNDLDGESLRPWADAAVTVRGSIAEPAVADALAAAAIERFGRIDTVVANAGIAANKPTLDLDHAEWRRTMEVNLDGVFLTCTAAGRHMVAAGSGTIVVLASMYGTTPAPERLAYCVSKAGAAMLARALAVEWAAKGVRVNAIAPGYVETDLVRDLAERGRLDTGALARRTPLGRLGTAEEVADLCVYLSTDANRWMTGQVVGLDGGWTAYGYL